MLFRQLFDPETSTYTYLIADEKTKTAALVDPVVTNLARDTRLLQELDLTLCYSLETHIHADHISAGHALREITQCKLGLPIGTDAEGADLFINDNDTLTLGACTIKALSTPGHTAQHFCYLINDQIVLTGDALFIRGCGRTDFQGGSAANLYDAVTQRLFTLPDKVLVYPGHDYNGQTCSSVGEEKRLNPRLAKNTKQEFIALMDNLNLPPPKKLAEAVPANLRCGIIEKS